jgi:hypothetical protein
MEDINYNNVEERFYNLVAVGLPEIQKLLYVVMLERGQLYASLIKLMALTETEEFELSVGDKEFNSGKYVLFMPGEEGTNLTVKLMEKQEEDGTA